MVKRLGCKRTWLTACFIDGGCGRPVWGHTNGFGDYVMFDELGPPWRVHPCYEDRFCMRLKAGDAPRQKIIIARPAFRLALRDDRIAAYRASLPRALAQAREQPLDTERILPEFYVKSQPLQVAGVVREIVAAAGSAILKGLGSLGAGVTMKILGQSRSQITIVDSDLASYTAFVDLSRQKIERGDLVEATLSVVKLDAMHPPYRFVCKRIFRPRLLV